MYCEDCGKNKEDAKIVSCPISPEIYGTIVIKALCNYCYEKRDRDIEKYTNKSSLYNKV